MAAQSSFSLSNFKATPDQIRTGVASIVGNNSLFTDLKIILEIGIKDISLFPNIRLHENTTYLDYLSKWIKGYEDASLNPPSNRKAFPKSSCSDPAIQTIVQIATNVDVAFIERMNAYHNLFMSAENIQGNLLEEYISNSVHQYGWIWCKGNPYLQALPEPSAESPYFLPRLPPQGLRLPEDCRHWLSSGRAAGSVLRRLPDRFCGILCRYTPLFPQPHFDT